MIFRILQNKWNNQQEFEQLAELLLKYPMPHLNLKLENNIHHYSFHLNLTQF